MSAATGGRAPALSPTLRANEIAASGFVGERAVLSLGFGEANLPVHPELAARLTSTIGSAPYAPVAGTAAARTAAAGWFARRRVPTEPDQIVFAPGSKPLLFAIMHCLGGDVVLPRPCWVTYAPQVAMSGRSVIQVPIPDEAGGVPDPNLLRTAIAEARAAGRNPKVLLLTIPDNPTGTVAGAQLVGQLCEIAEAEDLAIISDEIYRDLVWGDAEPVSPAELAPERTIVTSGLSKSLSLGGWRIGFARFPSDGPLAGLRDAVIGCASELWSCMATPMQDVAAYALDEPAELRAYVASARRVHSEVARAVHSIVVDAGLSCRPPTSAFYVYPDFEAWRPALHALGVHDGAGLAAWLLDERRLLVLDGAAFGETPDVLTARFATTSVYGRTDERRRAVLEAESPLTLPWVRENLERIEVALRAPEVGAV